MPREDNCADAQEVKLSLPTLSDEDLRMAAFTVREELNQRRRVLTAIMKEQRRRKAAGGGAKRV